MLSTLELVIRLILSAVAGGAIGIEREANNRPAGLRTHVLVTLGSTLIMMISMYGFDGLGPGGDGGDPARLAAQVVSGIGFLGAGTILRTGNNISGLTTAASIWVCGGIGLAIGNGYYTGGIATTLIVLFTLKGLSATENRLFKVKYKELVIFAKERPGLLGELGQIMGKYNIVIKDIRVVSDQDLSEDARDIVVRFRVKLPSKFYNDRFFIEVMAVRGIHHASWESDF